MLSYHNDEGLKTMVVAEMKKHQEQDQFIKGRYSEQEDGIFKGCAVGCTIDSINKVLGKSYDESSHSVFEETIGVPEWLARLQDTLFEHLPKDENSQFAVDFLDAIPVGVKLGPVKWKFCAFILKENIDRVTSLSNLPDEIRENIVESIRKVLKVHESAIEIGAWNDSAAASAAESADSAAFAARSAAWYAAASAAESARSAAAAARSAAFAAAEAAAESARSAASAAASAAWPAESAAESAAWSGAGYAAYKRYAAELIRLLKEAD
jgi:hypothetical protein